MVDAPNKKVKYPVRITVLESDLPAHMVLCRHTDLSVGRLPGPNWRQRPGRPHAQWTDQIRWDSSSSLVDLWRCAIRHGHAARAMQWPLLATWHWRWWWISLSALQDKGATFISILCEVTSRRYFCVFLYQHHCLVTGLRTIAVLWSQVEHMTSQSRVWWPTSAPPCHVESQYQTFHHLLHSSYCIGTGSVHINAKYLIQ